MHSVVTLTLANKSRRRRNHDGRFSHSHLRRLHLCVSSPLELTVYFLLRLCLLPWRIVFEVEFKFTCLSFGAEQAEDKCRGMVGSGCITSTVTLAGLVC